MGTKQSKIVEAIERTQNKALRISLHKKWSSPLRISSVNEPNLQETAGMVTFTKEILNGKPYFLYSVLNFKNPQEIVDNY